MTMIAVTYGYARVSRADDESKNLDTQLMLLAGNGIRGDLVFSDVASGRNLERTGWQELMARVQEGDTIVVAFFDRLSRNFDDGVRIQAELTRSNIGIVAIRENIDTREGRAGAKFFRRSMLAQGVYQVDSASERIRLGLDRALASGKRVGRFPALGHEQAEQCLPYTWLHESVLIEKVHQDHRHHRCTSHLLRRFSPVRFWIRTKSQVGQARCCSRVKGGDNERKSPPGHCRSTE